MAIEATTPRLRNIFVSSIVARLQNIRVVLEIKTTPAGTGVWGGNFGQSVRRYGEEEKDRKEAGEIAIARKTVERVWRRVGSGQEIGGKRERQRAREGIPLLQRGTVSIFLSLAEKLIFF